MSINEAGYFYVYDNLRQRRECGRRTAMWLNTSALDNHAMPLSPEDSPAIAAAAQSLKDRPAQTSPEPESLPVSYEALLPPEQLSRDLIEAARDSKGG